MSVVDQWMDFFERGGSVIWLILVISCLMWTMIIERYWFITMEAARRHASVLTLWHNAVTTLSHEAREWFRQGLLEQHHSQMRRYLPTIHSLTAILPLLGLLGTVTGMIKTFEALTTFGSGNIRGLAAGISEAMLTTMAGLVTALSGIFLITNLENRMLTAQQKLEANLSTKKDEDDDNDE